LGGTIRVEGRFSKQNLRSFQNEWAVGAWQKNNTIAEGNWQSAAGSLAATTAQFLRGTSNQLLGAL